MFTRAAQGPDDAVLHNRGTEAKMCIQVPHPLCNGFRAVTDDIKYVKYLSKAVLSVTPSKAHQPYA
jgi:hypothetical protein